MSEFAKLSNAAFLRHLEQHGLQPTPDEATSQPVNLVGGVSHEINLTDSILRVSGQRFGESGGVPGETSGK